MIRVVEADEVDADVLRAVFGERGESHRCQCQRYKLAAGQSFGGVPVEVRAAALRQQVSDEPTSGLVALDDGDAVGWCAVEPRPRLTGLVRTGRLVWAGRDEDRDDGSVWALTCVLVRSGHRRAGTGRALVRAAVDHARRHGAAALEGYPLTAPATIAVELHVGTLGMFLGAGFAEVARPSPRRAVVRIELR